MDDINDYAENDIKLDISKKALRDLTVEQLVDLKLEVDELAEKINSLIEECDEVLNS